MPHGFTGRIALCGVLAALMTAVMMLGTLLPFSSVSCPLLAGLCLIPAVWEFGALTGSVLYLTVSILSLIMCPDKEAAFLFLCVMGWYPVLRPRLQHITQKPLRAVVKSVLYNLSLALTYVLLLFVFPLPDLVADAKTWTGLFLSALVLLSNASFFVYDRLLGTLTDRYVSRLRPKLFSKHH